MSKIILSNIIILVVLATVSWLWYRSIAPTSTDSESPIFFSDAGKQAMGIVKLTNN